MKKYSIFLLITGLLTGIGSCKLEPDLYNTIEASAYPTNEQEFQTVIGNAYRGLILYYDREVYMPLNSSTDEWTAPVRRGGAWFDNGRWIYFANHSWNATAQDFNDTWDWLYTGIATCNNTLTILKASQAEVAGKEAALAELRGLRAFFYFLLCDNFGNVPIKTEDSPTGNIPQSTRTEVFNFIESELKEIIPSLNPTNHPRTYSKFTKETAHTLLAKLYLNAGVYTGTARWQDAVMQCDEVISSGKFSLNTNDFFAQFAPNNRSNGSFRENIFVIPYDKTDYRGDAFTGMAPNLFTMHPGLRDKYGLSESPWNGFSAIAEHYNSFDDQDIRKKGWIAGPQVDANGRPVIWNGQPLVLNENWTSLEQASDNDGARSVKFGMQPGNQFRLQDNHFPVFRYADVLMMKGEAAFRLGDIGTALSMFNQVRQRAGMPPYTAATLTLDEILAERGREFSFENWRRNDLIRFDKFGNGTWRFKTTTDKNRDLYPIPSQQMDTNPLLKQNPGY
jgi:starch-binding outer membrane protein, SusD/RagB family